MKKIETLDEIQSISFDMLMYISNIANRNHIHVMLAGGTLLGAVRNSDFIPWDDDVDLMLMRKDYDRLILCISKDNHPYYKVITMLNTPTYHFPHAKVVDTRTYQKERRCLQFENEGIAIDLFPIDYIPNKEASRRHLFLLINNTLYRAYDLLDTNYRDIGKGFEYYLRVHIIRLAATFAETVSRIVGIKKTDYAAVVIAQYHEKEIIRSECVNRYTKIQFHGKKFFAPIGYQQYLFNLYGKDYMTPPPENKRKPKHLLDVWWK